MARALAALMLGIAVALPAHAAPGAGNARAAAIAHHAAPVGAAQRDIAALIATLPQGPLRRATADALLNPATCVRHRAGLDAAARAAILDRLIAEALVAPPATADARAALDAGLFPPLADESSACPHLPQDFSTAPGGTATGHHSWPGGLIEHTAMNARVGLALAREVTRQAGTRVDPAPIVAAALWHDWAKTIVFQWRADGREFDEVAAGGAPGPGDTRTPVHHILALAEAIARGLPADQVLVQACAHGVPFDDHGARLINWLRAAALVARADPVARGLLVRAGDQWALPDQAALAPRWRTACLIHFQSDQNFVMTVGDAQAADAILERLAPGLAAPAPGSADWRWRWRHVAMARLGAGQIVLRWQAGGAAGLRKALARQGLR